MTIPPLRTKPSTLSTSLRSRQSQPPPRKMALYRARSAAASSPGRHLCQRVVDGLEPGIRPHLQDSSGPFGAARAAEAQQARRQEHEVRDLIHTLFLSGAGYSRANFVASAPASLCIASIRMTRPLVHGAGWNAVGLHPTAGWARDQPCRARRTHSGRHTRHGSAIADRGPLVPRRPGAVSSVCVLGGRLLCSSRCRGPDQFPYVALHVVPCDHPQAIVVDVDAGRVPGPPRRTR